MAILVPKRWVITEVFALQNCLEAHADTGGFLAPGLFKGIFFKSAVKTQHTVYINHVSVT